MSDYVARRDGREARVLRLDAFLREDAPVKTGTGEAVEPRDHLQRAFDVDRYTESCDGLVPAAAGPVLFRALELTPVAEL